ncbi:hypothetical protein QBC40DRAFT_167807 [Triangularia verruculosa]|uniref:Serum paraoxonase/arylesterase family protein n=1 Tax=Triangularia verruculosa TaxID=2587418 RepID=A0AAN6XSP6_9PEZI|nr:hypothetical protein QBC40DRAFT_167807 [Triangularia verruculosa]
MRSAVYSIIAALFAYQLYTLVPLIQRAVTVLGVFRSYPEGYVGTTQQVTSIPDTTHCEDLHHHIPSGLLFTACEDDAATRFQWFPPVGNLENPAVAAKSTGSIHVIDPKGLESRRLKFENFDNAFITHGIDIVDDPELPRGQAVYIFAVNHLPDPTPTPEGEEAKARSQIELFHHTIGTDSVRHIRSIWHPLIRTPNDVYGESPTSVYVTNDHYYTGHGIMRMLEDVYYGAKWTDTVHIKLDSLSPVETSDAGLTATIALSGVHNNNGLGHGRSEDEILIGQATSGTLHIAQLSPKGSSNYNITILDTLEVDSVVDNPSYFKDPLATSQSDDRSGFLLPGISKAVALAQTSRDPAGKDPVIVFYTKPVPGKKAQEWDTRIIFEDNSSRIRTASAAILVSLGKDKARLFVTGFVSANIIALDVDL